MTRLFLTATQAEKGCFVFEDSKRQSTPPLFHFTDSTQPLIVPTYSCSPTTATLAPTCPPRSTVPATSAPLVVTSTCSVLSQPAANVRSPTIAGLPMTGPPATLNFQRSFPSLDRQ